MQPRETAILEKSGIYGRFLGENRAFRELAVNADGADNYLISRVVSEFLARVITATSTVLHGTPCNQVQPNETAPQTCPRVFRAVGAPLQAAPLHNQDAGQQTPARASNQEKCND